MAAKTPTPGSEPLPLGNKTVTPGTDPVSDIPRVAAPAGQIWLSSGPVAPQTQIVRQQNQRIEAQAGLPWLPTGAPEATTPNNPGPRGGLGGGPLGNNAEDRSDKN